MQTEFNDFAFIIHKGAAAPWNEKKLKKGIIALLVILPLFNIYSEQIVLNPSFLKRPFEVTTYETASHVFKGEVIDVESRWVNTSKSNLIYTFATVKISEYEKGQGPNEVTVKYKGGVVGDIATTVHYTPHGVVKMKKGQDVIVFSNKLDQDTYETWYVKNQDKITTSPSMDFQDFGDYAQRTELTELDDVYEQDDEGFVFLDNIHWDTDDFEIDYYINEDGTSDCSGEFSATVNGFQTWEAVSSCSIGYDYQGTTSREESTDGYNVVDWEDYGSSTVGYTAMTWQLSTGKYLEFDIVANDYYEFCVGLTSGEYDIENLMTHEVGHTLALFDLWYEDNSAKTMYNEVDTNQISRRSLHSGDLAGARYVYD